MKRQQNFAIRRAQVRIEALPLPTRSPPVTLLAVVFFTLALAAVASQALPRILGA